MTDREHEIYEAIWRGERTGFSEAYSHKELAELRQLLADLQAGRITARRITGKGTRKPDALAWLYRRIEQEEEAIRTRGRSNFVNQSNVAYTLRKEAREAQHAEVTPAGLNYLLPGVDPIHTTPPTERQARLL